MDGNSWRDKIEKTMDAIHCSVVKIENEHGAKLEALFEGQADLKTDVAELKTDVADLKTDVAELKTGQLILKTDVAELKTGQQKIRGEIREVKDSVDLLRPIANDHESRI
ncbi:MAG: hypothetical protein JRJ87_14180 [Deltaproteobacteria bacterium]|nr:hypothetical protein [Deltaproteobacteria bacterium]